ncbi:MAG: murein biosynthesis integral membrane protein MurJ [Clostridia bacterium]|nr:murein biosynthesis integral membrane protein MurJ [Clostridia bacterium]
MKITKKNTALTAVFMIAATLAAKVCGMLRDILIAAMYGTDTAEAIAFSSASRIPVLFFDIALGSAVTSAFIPIFNQYLSQDGKERAMNFANLFINLVLFITCLLAALGIAFSRQVVTVIAGGYSIDILQLIASLVVILFPMIVFTGLAFCFVGILQSFGEFFIPSVISLVSNLVLILYLVIFKDTFGVRGVAVAMLVSWSTQVIVQLPALYKCGYRYSPRLSFKDEGIRRVCFLALPIILSSWVQPINNLINIRLASGLSEQGSVAALDYANRLYIILVGVFTYAVTNLIFPALSRADSSGDKDTFTQIMSTGLKYVLIVIIPIMTGFLLLSTPIIRLIYERGQFDSHSTMLTASALFYYSLGMAGYALQEISNRAFYAMNDGKTPMVISVCGISVNILLSIVLVWGFSADHRALAFAASVSANLMGISALLLANRRAPGIVNKSFLYCLVKVVISALIMASAVVIINSVFEISSRLLSVLVPAFVGAVIYFVCCMVFRVHEVSDILNKALNKLKPGQN